MKKTLCLLCFATMVWQFGCASQHVRPLVADGFFRDWSELAVSIDDPRGDATGATDLLEVSGQRSGPHLFLRIRIAEAANLQKPEEGGGLRIEIAGADETLVLHTADRRIERNGTPIPFAEIDYIGLPTHASAEFELRMRAPRGALQIDVSGSDALPAPLQLGGGSSTVPPREVAIERGDAPLRVVSWNVLQGGPFNDPEREADGRAVLAALDADVLLLQEAWRIPDFAQRIRDLCGDDWNLQEFGGVAVASRLPLTLLELEPPVELDDRRRPRGGDTWSVMRNLFVGVDTPVGPLVVVSAHWKCCGSSGSREDLQRMDDALVALKSIWRLRDAGNSSRSRRSESQSPIPDRFADAPLLIAGDYNLVGSRAPLDMLLAAGMVDLVPLQSDEWSAVTWRSLRDEQAGQPDADRSEWKPGGYPPGRLDLIVADRKLNVQRTFIADLGAPTLVSDHLPLVVDIAE